MPKIRTGGLLLAAFVLLANATPLWAFGGSIPPTPIELKTLPPYCTPKAIKETPGRAHRDIHSVKRWSGILGADWRHIHHYCNALLMVNRSHGVLGDKTQLAYLRKVALADFDYTQKHATPGFILNPEVALKKGKLLATMGNSSGAIAEYYKAIKYKPDYAPAYARLFDVYMDMGLVSDAETALKNGLAKAPKSKSLNSRIKVLKKAKKG